MMNKRPGWNIFRHDPWKSQNPFTFNDSSDKMQCAISAVSLARITDPPAVFLASG